MWTNSGKEDWLIKNSLCVFFPTKYWYESSNYSEQVVVECSTTDWLS